jgi:hypothetical protein
MNEDNTAKLIDLEDRNASLKRLDNKLDALREGFMGLSLDYGFHIENTWGGNHKIFELRDNVIYRLFSSAFHFQLLLREHIFIEKKIVDIKIKDGAKMAQMIYGRHPYFGYAEQSVSALFDSVVFHLASVYDYMSILINFICVPEKEKTPSWTTLCKTARGRVNAFSGSEIAKAMDAMDREFVIKLYDHRSELIHRHADISKYLFDLKLDLEDTTSKFVCSQKIRRTFKHFGDKDVDYTVSYFSVWLIDKTSDTVAELIRKLKANVQKNSKFPFHTFKDGSKPILIAVDNNNTAVSPSLACWSKFDAWFNNAVNH